MKLCSEDDSGLVAHLRGVAHYRAGNLDAALQELLQACKLRQDDNSLGLDVHPEGELRGVARPPQSDDLHRGSGFFLAMIYQKKGDPVQARSWFDRSTAWMKAHEPNDRFLIVFRGEAAAPARPRPAHNRPPMTLADQVDATPFMRRQTGPPTADGATHDLSDKGVQSPIMLAHCASSTCNPVLELGLSPR